MISLVTLFDVEDQEMGYTYRRYIRSEAGAFGCVKCKTHLAALEHLESHVRPSLSITDKQSNIEIGISRADGESAVI